MHHYRPKRIIKTKYRETKVVNYRQDNDVFNTLLACTFLDCDEYRMDYDGQIDTTRCKRALGIQYKHESKEDIAGFISKPVARPEYRTIYQHKGMLLQNLHCRYLYILIKLPNLLDLEQRIPDFLNCDNYGSLSTNNPDPMLDDTPTNHNELHEVICNTFKIDYFQEMDIFIKLRNRLERKIKKAIIPILKDFEQQINNTNDRLIRQYRMMTIAHERNNRLFRQTHKTFQIHHLALLMFKDYITILVGTLQRIHRQYMRCKSALDDTLIGIKNINSGYLTHHILDPKILAKYLEAVEDDLEETVPEFEPIFTIIYQYYGNSLISFTNTIDDLLLQLPILIKLKVQVPMSLFSIKTAPVPLDADTRKESTLK